MCITIEGVLEVVVPLIAVAVFVSLGYVMGRIDFLKEKRK